LGPLDLLILVRYSAPVALAGLGETVSQRSGVINIGLEGVMLVGAYAGMTAGYTTGSPWLGLLAGCAAGVLLAAVLAWFTVYLASDQVVVGTASNLLALGLCGTLYRQQFGQTGKLISVNRIPDWNGIDAVIVALILAVPLVWWLLKRTGWGLALRAAGEYPKAAEAAGFSVHRLRFGAMLVNGLFGGLAGAYLSLGVAASFSERMVGGRGFVAIAMVTFGRWRPQYVFLAALLIGFADSLQFRFQTFGWKVPFQLMIAMPYLVALAVLVLVGKGTVAPQALGIAYRREK